MRPHIFQCITPNEDEREKKRAKEDDMGAERNERLRDRFKEDAKDVGFGGCFDAR